MKRRFKRSRICSSENYELSRKVHIQYLRELHYKNVVLIEEIVKISNVKRAYVKCFGELIPITLEEAHKIEKSVTIIYK